MAAILDRKLSATGANSSESWHDDAAVVAASVKRAELVEALEQERARVTDLRAQVADVGADDDAEARALLGMKVPAGTAAARARVAGELADAERHVSARQRAIEIFDREVAAGARRAAQRREATKIQAEAKALAPRLQSLVRDLLALNADAGWLDTVARADFDPLNKDVGSIEAHLTSGPYPGGLEVPIDAHRLQAWLRQIEKAGF